MSLNESIRVIASRKAKKNLAPYGKWVPFAWQARGLIERDRWGVSAAIREIVHQQHLTPSDKAFKGIRSAYYEIRYRAWPENL